MRRFVDSAGNRWDVVLGRESWGTLVLLFVPGDNGPVRQAYFPAKRYDSSATELDEMSDAGLQQLLDASELKTE